MRKILYVLCLLTTLVACSDDDDKIITDYDKPYSKLPTSELRTLIEDNINSCITLVEEFAEMEENNSILDIMNYYGINFYFDISDFMNSRSSDQSKENTFTGMKLVWECEFHLALRAEDYEAAHAKHAAMGCICFENPAMGIYFVTDPDGYWIEIIPTR